MNSKFDELVGSLEGETLEELRRAVASEIGGRRRQTDIHLEDIHPQMSAADKDRAALQIARLLRGEDPHA
jgi:hypothetical protein